jgi:hypothetical protein
MTSTKEPMNPQNTRATSHPTGMRAANLCRNEAFFFGPTGFLWRLRTMAASDWGTA